MEKGLDQAFHAPASRERGALSGARCARRRIARTREVVLGQLSAAEREAICAQAYAIYAAYKAGVDRRTFDRQLCAGEETRVALFYGEEGALVGFCSAAIQRVEHEGRRHAVYSALLFIDTRYKGVSETRSFTLRDAMRFRLREPWTPLYCMGVIMTPASYRRFAITMPRIYPSRHAPVPEAARALVRKTARLRGLDFVDEERWLVRGMGAPRHPERLRDARTLKDDPDARFFLTENPRFDDGVAMLVWIPLDLKNLGGALARHFARLLAGADRGEG